MTRSATIPSEEVAACWISHLACGHTSPWITADGHRYGQARPGTWISCSVPPCQTQRKVVSVEPVAVVVGADSMEWPIFCKHFSARHPDSLGGMKSLEPDHAGDNVKSGYRAFHRRLHETRLDLNHEHNPW